jgi:hypothetical protein
MDGLISLFCLVYVQNFFPETNALAYLGMEEKYLLTLTLGGSETFGILSFIEIFDKLVRPWRQLGRHNEEMMICR